jgi:hypothetical protein
MLDMKRTGPSSLRKVTNESTYRMVDELSGLSDHNTTRPNRAIVHET